MQRRFRSTALAALAGLMLAACGDKVCTLQPRPAMLVHVRDSVTNAGIVGGTKLVIRDGTYGDSIVVAEIQTGEGPMNLGENRPGVYTLTVSKPGYRTWSRSSISVGHDDCGTTATDVVVLLQPIER